MDKKLAAAAGATVTSAAFQLSTVVWPDWIKHHTEVIWSLWGLAVVLWLWWGIAHLITAQRGSAKAPDASPSVNAPIHFAPVITVSPNISPVQTNEQVVDLSQHAAAVSLGIPKLGILQVDKPRFCLLYRTHIAWQVAAPGIAQDVTLGAIAWVHNPTAEEGELAKPIRTATASVVYRGDNGILACVPTAYWLERYENQADIKVGQSCGVLLGILPSGLDGQIWTALENPDSHPFQPRLDRVAIVAAPKYSQLILSRVREIEVSIVSHEITLKRFTVYVESRGPGKYDLTLTRTT